MKNNQNRRQTMHSAHTNVGVPPLTSPNSLPHQCSIWIWSILATHVNDTILVFVSFLLQNIFFNFLIGSWHTQYTQIHTERAYAIFEWHLCIVRRAIWHISSSTEHQIEFFTISNFSFNWQLSAAIRRRSSFYFTFVRCDICDSKWKFAKQKQILQRRIIWIETMTNRSK